MPNAVRAGFHEIGVAWKSHKTGIYWSTFVLNKTVLFLSNFSWNILAKRRKKSRCSFDDMLLVISKYYYCYPGRCVVWVVSVTWCNIHMIQCNLQLFTGERRYSVILGMSDLKQNSWLKTHTHTHTCRAFVIYSRPCFYISKFMMRQFTWPRANLCPFSFTLRVCMQSLWLNVHYSQCRQTIWANDGESIWLCNVNTREQD